MEDVVFTLGFLGVCALAGFAYVLPLMLAVKNRHPSAAGVAVVNIFLGWTMVGWVIALAWAVSSPVRKVA